MHGSLTSVQAVKNKLQTVLENPVPVMNWRAVLRFDEYVKNLAPLDFTKLCEDCTVSDVGPSHPNCRCGVDPMVVCEAHPCYCGCQKSGKLQGCAWRSRARKYMEQHCPHDFVARMAGKVTYMQILHHCGRAPPLSARERNLLNIVVAKLVDLKGVMPPYAVVDQSQSIGMGSLRVDGVTTTCTLSFSGVLCSVCVTCLKINS